MVARLAALLLATALAGCAAAPAPAAPQRDRPPVGFAAALHDETGPRSGDLVTWTTYWELTWEEVDGAASYAVWYATPEGDGTRAHELDAPRLRLSVVTGTTTPADRAVRRDQELTVAAAQLSVRVAARFPDGELGPASPWLPVGRTLPR